MKTRLTVLSISLFLYPGQMLSQVTHFVSPTYPVLARQARIEGIVTAEVRLTPAGTVDSVESSGRNPMLKEEVIHNVKQWRFVPGKTQMLSISYEFKLVKPDLRYSPEPQVSLDMATGSEPTAIKVLVISHAPQGIQDNVILRPKR